MSKDTGWSRREFIKVSAMSIPVPAMLPHVSTSKNRPRKPNLLFLWTDEQRADTMAAYGNEKIHAPNMNKLAGESVVFDRAYVSQPVCTPSRSTVMTGLWPHQNGCTQNNVALRPEVPTFPELAKDADYRTGYFGKWHLGDEIYAQHGFEEWRSIEDMYAKYYGADRNETDRSSYHAFLEGLGYKPNTDGGQFSRGFAARLPIDHCKPKFLEQETCAFLERHCNDPFMLYVNFLEPHMPFYGPLDNEHDPAEVDLPANFLDPLEENEPEVYRKLREGYHAKPYNDLDLNTEAGWRRLIANYWGLVTQVDRSVGAILEKLERLGLAEDTIVVYTSDHGDMMGSHQLLAKTVMYEESVRVPWLMRIPELGRTQRHVPHPVSHIDLVPTLLDFMQMGERALPGQSLRGAMAGGKPTREEVVVEWTPPDPFAGGRNPYGSKRQPLDPPGNAVRTVVSPDGWKLSLHSADHNELFHLTEDPGETTNLFGTEALNPIVERLTARLRAWQADTKDA